MMLSMNVTSGCGHEGLVTGHNCNFFKILRSQVLLQGAMYKEMDIADRAKAIARLAFQWDVLNSIIKGPYVSGDHLGLADAALFPSLVFARAILPSVFGWNDLFAKREKLGKYWDTMANDSDAAKVSLQPRATTC
jgi:glutathione S-transferase